jgi:hypothetical protein
MPTTNQPVGLLATVTKTIPAATPMTPITMPFTKPPDCFATSSRSTDTVASTSPRCASGICR